jgi:hypothetical protein
VIPQDVGSIIRGKLSRPYLRLFQIGMIFVSLFGILMVLYLLNNTGEKKIFDTLDGKRKKEVPTRDTTSGTRGRPNMAIL